ncbi:6-N-hydroxylaminopurine resistance protein [Pirellulimonas nuda]|uniref:6-N-hydroxylaminopurine resistance protein n=1 Tax=Pirellulimonas nuda TaxID=2528009 RepID=A0A518D7M0_9BACT|nr:MOSC domain-containing protein [Pirellulimonas nuda]QDU87473.1 6-N-hydroxylaminopurine resistance protein [Pirellulimonas nuda]
MYSTGLDRTFYRAGGVMSGGLGEGLRARLASVQTGMPQTRGEPGAADVMDRPWTTAFYKTPVDGRVWLGKTGLAGDGQADQKNHGGPDKAACVYPADHYGYWQAELGVSPLPHGAFGENFTTLGVTEADLCIGDVFSIGPAVVQVSQPRQPCWKLARRWRAKDLALRVQQNGRTGWYFRVLQEGEVERGAELLLKERPHPRLTLADANDLMHHRKHDLAAAATLAACPALSASWQATLNKRVQSGESESIASRVEGANGGGA